MVALGYGEYPSSRHITRSQNSKGTVLPSPPTPADSPQASESSSSTSSQAPFTSSGVSPDDTLLTDHHIMAKSVHPSPSSSLGIRNNDNDPMIEDMPLLVSDHEVSDNESSYSGVSSLSHKSQRRPANESIQPISRSPTVATRQLQRQLQPGVVARQVTRPRSSLVKPSEAAEQVKKSLKSNNPVPNGTGDSQGQLSPEQFKHERNQLMTIIVKYIATKIHNSFPPESPRLVNPDELPLDKFLLLLTSRLQLSLPMFMKGIIYLFRYMDIIYLLRYLNQSNNFANYTDMGFELKKLIIGCFKLAIMREKRLSALKSTEGKSNQPGLNYNHNWSVITGLPSKELSLVVKQIVSRMNGKLNIKNIELIKMKSEIFRFVKMVATEV